MEVLIDDRCGAKLDEEMLKLLERVVRESADLEAFEKDFEVGISLVSEEEIQELNRRYREKDAVTDVLSFPMYEEGDMEPVQLGDVVICHSRAMEQAGEYGHSMERELCFLTAHGMLHLFGHDHFDEDEKEEMQTREKELMRRIQMTR